MPVRWQGFDYYFSNRWLGRAMYLNLAGMVVLILSGLFSFRPLLFLLIPILPISLVCNFMMFRYRERWAKAKREHLPPGRHLITRFFLHPTIAVIVTLVLLVAVTTVVYEALHR